MRQFYLIICLTLTAFLLTSGSALAQRGRGRTGSAGGPPPSERSRGSDRSHAPKQSGETVKSEHRMHSATIGDHLEKNTHLAARLQGMFPPGTNLQEASSGFKNLGQFVAATHVSHNLGIPFDQLKAKMTGDSAVSLGKAIHDLRPELDAESEAKQADQQAKEDIRQAERKQKTQPVERPENQD